jgi:hypothetical protein
MAGFWAMRVISAVFAFLGSRLWLAGVVSVSGAIIALILAMPMAPEIEREPAEWCLDEVQPRAVDKVASRSIQTVGFEREAQPPERGAWLTGAIENVPQATATRVTTQTEEALHERH